MGIIYKNVSYNEYYPSSMGFDTNSINIYDHHFEGIKPILISKKEFIEFYEPLEKNSLDFVPIFSAKPTEQLCWKLLESARLKILLIDERITEIAYKELYKGKPKAQEFYGDDTRRLIIAKYAGIFICTHLIIDEKEVPLHEIAREEKTTRVCVKITKNDNKTVIKDVCWKNGDEIYKINPDCLILHQGVAEDDNLLRKTIDPSDKKDNFSESFKIFLTNIQQKIPYIIIDSGRGIPSELPVHVKYMPFSIVEDSIMKESISKFTLVNMLMGLTR